MKRSLFSEKQIIGSFEKPKGKKLSKPFAPSITSVRQHSMPGDANMVAWKSVMPVSSDL